MNLLSPISCEKDILIAAKDLGITAYGASYIILANKYKLVPVSEDRDLRAKANNLVKTISLREIS